MPAPLTPMDAMRPITFRDALLHLQALIGAEINVTMNYDGHFFGSGFAGRLDRVDTFPPDNSAIKVVLQDNHGFFLDPADTDAFAGPIDDSDARTLELKLAFGVSLTIEPSDS